MTVHFKKSEPNQIIVQILAGDPLEPVKPFPEALVIVVDILDVVYPFYDMKALVGL